MRHFDEMLEIKLQEPTAGLEKSAPRKVQIARVGTFTHPEYGKFEITPKTLSDFKKNFDGRARRVDIAIDYFHDNEKIAAGWIKDLMLSEDGKALFADVDWTPRANKMLCDRELRYFSPEFMFKYRDPETKQQFDNVLLGGGLTNRPHIKEMEPIVASEKGANNVTELEKAQAEVKALTLKLSEAETKQAEMKKKLDDMAVDPDAKEVEDLKKQVADLSAKVDALMSQNVELADKNKKLEETNKLSEKKAKFAVLMSEGKACAAQEEAYLAGDMEKFISLHKSVNLNEGGNGGAANADAKTKTEAEDKILELSQAKAKEKSISLSEAIKQVRAEKPELAKLVD